MKDKKAPFSDDNKAWDARIAAVEERLSKAKPSAPIILDGSAKVVDIDKFIETHLAIVKSHNGNKTFEPYLLRLEKFVSMLD